MSGVAYKLVDRAEWIAALAAGVYAGSALDRADGYIHMSTAAQLAETARRHYAGRRELVLVEVDLFPHLFAPLPAHTDAPQRGLSVDTDGVMHFEDGAIGWP